MKWYKSLTLLLGFVVLSNVLPAQVRGHLAVGPKVGYNFSRVNLDNATSISGLAIGITSEYWLNAYSALSLDILHSQEGYEVPLATVNLDYLQFPLLYNVIFGSANSLFQPKIYLGFSPGILLNAEINGVDAKEQHNETVFNLTGGLGSIINVSKRFWLHADVRAHSGLTNAQLNASTLTPVKNRTLQVSLGLVYGF